MTAELIHRLRDASHISVLTGAGVSAESGIRTFRDPDGLWSRFRPEELANVRAFLANPELVQGWYAHRRAVVEDATPNPGHDALAALERTGKDISIITQNVDGLHQRAGSSRVIELHGSIMRSYCMDCGADADPSFEGEGAHRCGSCSGLVRPAVVWFGEMLPQAAMEQAVGAANEADVFLSIGTSAVVYPAADLPLLAGRSGAYTVEVNVARSAIAHEMHEVLIGPSGTVLPELLAAAFPSAHAEASA